MRILHVILSEGFKGSERSAAEYCNYLANAGHEVGIVISDAWTVRRLTGRGGVRGSITDHLDARVEVFRIPRRWFAQRALRRIVAARAPDIVHAHLTRAVRLVAGLNGQVATAGTLHMHRFNEAYLGIDAIFCVARWQQRLIIALPGPPVEMRPMFQDSVAALLRTYWAGRYRTEIAVHTDVSDESLLNPLFERVMAAVPGSYLKADPKGFGPDIRLTVYITGDGPDEDHPQRERGAHEAEREGADRGDPVDDEVHARVMRSCRS